jgi:glutamyl-tRNA reductase
LTQAGLDLARRESGGLTGRRALVLGTGVTGRLAARLLRGAGVASLTVAGRTPSAAADLAATVDATPADLHNLPALLAEADVLVVAVGAAAPVVLADHLKSAGSLTVVDLGVPGNVEPSAAHIRGVHLINVEAIGRHLHGQASPHGLDDVRRIVEAEAVSYVSHCERAKAAPVITAMHTDIGQLVEVELVRLHSRLPELTAAQRLAIEASIHRIIGQFLHKPSLRAKELTAHSSGSRHLHALSELFGTTARGASTGDPTAHPKKNAA